jgi:hypothetical protein
MYTTFSAFSFYNVIFFCRIFVKLSYLSIAFLFSTAIRVKDGSENPFMKRSAIKDCNEQPDPQCRLLGRDGGTRPHYFPFQTCDFFK